MGMRNSILREEEDQTERQAKLESYAVPAHGLGAHFCLFDPTACGG